MYVVLYVCCTSFHLLIVLPQLKISAPTAALMMMNPKIIFKGENPFSDGNTYNQFVFSGAFSSIRASFEMCRTD
jgi:hypothetical protein